MVIDASGRVRRPRAGGDPESLSHRAATSDWVPAFAGMTMGGAARE